MKIVQLKGIFLKRFYLFVWLLITVVGFLIYSNTFDSEFQLDDGFHILVNDDIKELGNYKSFTNWTNVSQRPLSKFTLALNYNLHQTDVFGYHLFNIIIHILTSGFVFLFLLEIFKSRCRKDSRFNVRGLYFH